MQSASTHARSSRREVRNPVLALPAARALQRLPADQLLLLADLFRDMATDARARADHCWARHKSPMALYWKSVSVYANHINRVLRAAARLGPRLHAL